MSVCETDRQNGADSEGEREREELERKCVRVCVCNYD